ncbi:hypothetical protein [Streptomyces sp. NBC_01294]|uniref:hypothetical protein n=1 Tax=Streptomyces sp. NBC_01294 TaxID=2903815 RepID=UPI002DDC8D97|nr:hypothetical protein [Streptomyces sp. NBC_01294]WRZ59131.1 hypothetical protein OG534_23185 [Streptomyces sp. NBC_01294]
MTSVFPYPTLFGDVELRVVSVSVDNRELPYTMISVADRAVALHQTGRGAWDRARLRLSVTFPEAELRSGPWSDVVFLAVLAEKATNARTTVVLSPAGDGTMQGTIELDSVAYLRRATLGVSVVATVEGVAGRLVGSAGSDWYVDLKASTPARQREIEIVEVDFKDGEHEWLRPYKESAWIVETTGDVPTVYLNIGAVEGLMEALRGSGGSPAERMLRDLAATQIAQDAWTAMFHTAISDLDADEDGTPMLPKGWRESVLRSMLPDVLPGRQLTDALYEIAERRTKGYGWAEIQTGVQFAAGKRSRATRNLTNAVRSVQNLEGSGGTR